MNEDQNKGKGKDIKGSIKETIGKAIGSDKMKNEGRAEQAKGKVQESWGDTKDTVNKK